MDLCYYNSEERNFGDDLNPYIIRHLIPNYTNILNDTVLYFIGTILYDGFASEKNITDFDKKKKIVLGSGVRFLNKPPKIDLTWDIRFLRGPLSSLILKKDYVSFITDPAYLIRETPIFKSLPPNKKYKISLMPHFSTVDKIDWKTLCKEYDVNFINPSEHNIDHIISEIAQSDKIITEAMHGAIIADALRVPWKRFKYISYIYESEMVSEFKWADWLYSMNLEQGYYSLFYNKLIREIDKRIDLKLLKYIRKSQLKDSFSDLIKNNNYQLSNEKILNGKMIKLMEEVDRINKHATNI